LPRWTIAGLILLFGRDSEWVVRLPSAAAALGSIALVYLLGRRMAGREVGLASGYALASSCFFITELRQAGNDGPLAFFTTLAFYAAWRALHADRWEGEGTIAPPGVRPGERRWGLLFGAGLGLGFLCKGPIVFLLVGPALLGYLVCARSFLRGLRVLADWRALVIATLLAASWPVPVAIADPNAVRVWMLEMGQKTGAAGIPHHQSRENIALSWFWMTAPWSLIATSALLMPFWRAPRVARPGVWFSWWWAVAGLAIFSTWSVAKPNYYLPCLPAAGLLVGLQWVRLAELARGVQADAKNAVARRSMAVLRLHWVALLLVALGTPVVVGKTMPSQLAVAAVAGILAAVGIAFSIAAWRKGRLAGSLGVQGATVALLVALAYGFVAPRHNSQNGHHRLAKRLEHLTDPAATIMFFREIDEGLWFYLHDRKLAAVPNSQPRYNKDLDLIDDLKSKRFTLDWTVDEKTRRAQLARQRAIADRDTLIDWIHSRSTEAPYVLLRARTYEEFQRIDTALDSLATPVLREENLDRTELVLLRVHTPVIASETREEGSRR
jgi:4-amino-4-deoxy-L-arabinose transferase-like glycosyltransferase